MQLGVVVPVRSTVSTTLLGELDGNVIGYAMGPVIDVPAIADEMFSDAACHAAERWKKK